MQLRRTDLTSLLLVPLFVAGAIAACSGSTGGPEGDTDAGTTGGTDAGTRPDAGTGTTDAGTTDAGSPDAGIVDPYACGDLDGYGNCDGTLAQWCNEERDRKEYIDCTDIAEDEEGNVVAGVCTMLPDWGSWCAVGEGTYCAIEDEEGYYDYYACGDASGAKLDLACDLDRGCVATSVTCEYPGDEEYYDPKCDGTMLILDCTVWNQAVQLDCTGESVGGTACSSGTCTGITAGNYCDDELFFCASGLTCNDDFECE